MENVNYFVTGKESIWGRGDTDTLKLLDGERIKGRWLNLAAGDGRYNTQLLEKADFVIASDIDKRALDKLYNVAPEEYRRRLELKVFDIAAPFPFEDVFFDGVLCTGILHLFPTGVLKHIISEISRVLKDDGRVIIDFATDIKRTRYDGSAYLRAGETRYSLRESALILKALFKDYNIKMHTSKVSKEKVQDYVFSCKFILLVAKKKR